METIEDIIFSLTNLVIEKEPLNELISNDKIESDFFYFVSPSLATVSDILVNQSVSLDYIVNFSKSNNLAITNVNTTTKNVIFANNQIKDKSILNSLNSKRLKFANGTINLNSSYSYLLQENGFYLLQENGYKIIL
jgi:hypothetical protein